MTAVLVAALALALEPAGGEVDEPSDPPRLEAVVLLEGAWAQLAHARELKGRMIGTAGPDREEARRRAVEAYGAVWRYWPDEREAAAEASFRAGELLRAAGEQADALRSFRRARNLAPRTVWRARAAFEIGHLHRRAGRLESALVSYADAYDDAFAARRVRDRARFWAARVQERRGRHAEARLLFDRVAREAEDPVDRVRSFDRLASACLARGDEVAADVLLERCRASVARVAAEETECGRRVRSALVRMSAARERSSANTSSP